MRFVNYFTLLILLLLVVSVNGYSLTNDEILQKIDEYHLIASDFEMTIRVESFKNNHFDNTTLMKCYVNDGKIASLNFLEPENMKGRKIVVKDNDMWLIIPKVKNPIHITPSQRLVGGISFSDIAGVKFAENYIAKINGEEVITGLNAEGNKTDISNNCLVMELSTNDTRSNYHKIIMWADKQSFLPVKADFFALSGKKMMTVYYTSPKVWEGRLILTKMYLFDQINTSKYCTVEYSEIKMLQFDNNYEN